MAGSPATDSEPDVIGSALRLRVPALGERDFSGEAGFELLGDRPGCVSLGYPNKTSGSYIVSAVDGVSGARVRLGYQR